MPEMINTVSKKSGLPPGSLVHIGYQTGAPVNIMQGRHINKEFELVKLASVEDVTEAPESAIQLLLIEGLEDVNVVRKIGHKFGVHELILEDILNTHQRPKFEDHEDYLYIVLKHFTAEHSDFKLHAEQISLLIFEKQVIVFREYSDDLLQPIHQRMQTKKSLISELGTGYLGYVILDYIVDLYFNLNEAIEEHLEALEEKLLDNGPSHELLTELQSCRKELAKRRRYVSPLLELNNALFRLDTSLINTKSRVYFNDVSDHIIRVVEAYEAHRESLSELIVLYMTIQSNKLNDVMKVLTLFSTIFIPLTFITGVYGMNFEFMPELKLHWAYPSLLGLFFVIAAASFWLFKRKRWL